MEERLAGANLSFYLRRPRLEISLRELEETCLKRLQLLRDIEISNEVLEDGIPKADFPMMEKDKEAGFLGVSPTIETPARYAELEHEARLRDEASHFILKLVYCGTTDSCKWFIHHESGLFFKRMDKYLHFWEANDFLNRMLGYTYDVRTEVNEMNKEIKKDWFKVPINHATHLLFGKDALFPQKGYVEVPDKMVFLVISKLFEDMLSLSMFNAQSCLREVEEDDRISDLIKHLRNPGSSVVPRPIDSKAKLNLEHLEPNVRHFPPCMKSLHFNLKKDHHLKHFGRLQFGLFLKAIGLSYEDSLKFWKGEFCQKMTPDKFHKDYEYNIKHSYGKVGKMVDYTASGCSKLSHMPQPAAQEHHGCPFRHCGRDELARLLTSYGLNPLELESIFEKAESHPQVACIRLFKASHKGAPESATDHIGHYPAAFYEASKRLEIG